jgi:hypothetical protein
MNGGGTTRGVPRGSGAISDGYGVFSLVTLLKLI